MDDTTIHPPDDSPPEAPSRRDAPAVTDDPEPPLSDRLSPIHALRSVATTARLVFDDRLQSPRRRVGTRVRTDDGQTFTVYRETHRTPADPVSDRTVLAVRFHSRGIGGRAIRRGVFQPLSILGLPIVAGLPGFRTKLWLADREAGDYLGLYEWGTEEEALAYATALKRVLERLSTPGSATVTVSPDTTLARYLEVHRPDS